MNIGKMSLVITALLCVVGTSSLSASGCELTSPVLTMQSAHTNTVTGAYYLPSGSQIVSSSYDWSAKLWDASDGSLIRTYTGHTNLIYDIAVSPTGSTFATASADNSAKIWDVATGGVVHNLVGHGEEVITCAYSPDGSLLASGGGMSDKSVIVWNTSNGSQVNRFFDHNGGGNYVTSVTFSPDGSLLASSGNFVTVIRDTATWNVQRTVAGIRALFSPDSQHVLVAGPSVGPVTRYEIATGNPVATYPNPVGALLFHPLEFSFDGNQLLIQTQDSLGSLAIILYNAATGIEVCRILAGTGTISYSPDDSRIATTGNAALKVEVWENPLFGNSASDWRVYE